MEEDLQLLFNCKNLSSRKIDNLIEISKKNKKISYIPYLIETYYELPNLQNYSTHNILLLLEYLFEDPKEFQNHILQIGEILVLRKDLFIVFMDFLKSRSVYSDDYYWYPDLQFTNIYSFICNLFTDISSLVLFYCQKEFIMQNREVLEYCESFLTKYTTNPTVLMKLNIMKKDFELLYDPKVVFSKFNIPINEKTLIYRTFVSHVYWCENDCDTFEYFDIQINTTKEFKANLCGCLSLVEVELGSQNKTFLVSLKNFEGLIMKNEKYLEYWKDQGVVNENWECLI